LEPLRRGGRSLLRGGGKTKSQRAEKHERCNSLSSCRFHFPFPIARVPLGAFTIAGTTRFDPE
jgi:hypothetical protein